MEGVRLTELVIYYIPAKAPRPRMVNCHSPSSVILREFIYEVAGSKRLLKY